MFQTTNQTCILFDQRKLIMTLRSFCRSAAMSSCPLPSHLQASWKAEDHRLISKDLLSGIFHRNYKDIIRYSLGYDDIWWCLMLVYVSWHIGKIHHCNLTVLTGWELDVSQNSLINISGETPISYGRNGSPIIQGPFLQKNVDFWLDVWKVLESDS